MATDLSRGQQQKVMIAGAFFHEPAVVFIDGAGQPRPHRPGTGQALPPRVPEAGNTVVITTHDVDVAAELCSRVGVVHGGGLLVADVRPSELSADETLLDVFLDRVDATVERVSPRMTDGRTRRVFVEMLREEWRMHSHLSSAGSLRHVPGADRRPHRQRRGCSSSPAPAGDRLRRPPRARVRLRAPHRLDRLRRPRRTRNLLGDLTLLVFTARTLPLSQDRLLGIFVVKDLVYYAILFLLPMALGTARRGRRRRRSSVAGGGGVASVLPAVGTALGLWATLTLTFVLGMAATIAALGIVRRGVPG